MANLLFDFVHAWRRHLSDGGLESLNDMTNFDQVTLYPFFCTILSMRSHASLVIQAQRMLRMTFLTNIYEISHPCETV